MLVNKTINHQISLQATYQSLSVIQINKLFHIKTNQLQIFQTNLYLNYYLTITNKSKKTV